MYVYYYVLLCTIMYRALYRLVILCVFLYTVQVDGRRLKTFGSSGSQQSQFRNPYHVTVDRRDNIIVSDSGNNCLKVSCTLQSRVSYDHSLCNIFMDLDSTMPFSWA